MALPFFYISDYERSKKEFVLEEDTSRHVVQVLRMKPRELLSLTDGNGILLSAAIVDNHKKYCSVKVQEIQYKQPTARKVSIAISLLKNANRFEWFLEKATEIGINEIIPMICQRTEKEKFRDDRLKGILISAMLQSQQCWLPLLHKPITFKLLLRQDEVVNTSQKFIAHCIEDEKRNLADLVNGSLPSQIILIGPEGDFTTEEIDFAIENNFDAVALGETRLRAETAGIVAATILKSL
ncbi:MAG: RsmE family RNA methyltransferase [Chitinophagaceae bacterium]